MATITEDYVSFETAKLLKEKGFGIEEETRGYYPIKGDATGKLMFGAEYHHNTSQVQIAAPTFQMAMKWLREEKGVYIEISIVGVEWEAPTKWYFGWRCQTKYVIDRLRSRDANYTSYEEACEAAIKYCLENLI